MGLISGSTEFSISGKVRGKCHAVLKRSGKLKTNVTLKNFFATAELIAFEAILPDDTSNEIERCEAFIAALLPQKDSAGTPALVIFLRELRNTIDEGNGLYQDIDDVLKELGWNDRPSAQLQHDVFNAILGLNFKAQAEEAVLARKKSNALAFLVSGKNAFCGQKALTVRLTRRLCRSQNPLHGALKDDSVRIFPISLNSVIAQPSLYSQRDYTSVKKQVE